MAIGRNRRLQLRANRGTFTTTTLLSILLALAACVSKPPPGTTETTLIEGKDGAAIVDTYQASATVAGINFDTRTVKLLFADGTTKTYKVDQQVVNFDRIKLGDQVKATVIEEIAVFLAKGQGQSSIGAGTAVALAPKNVRPGIVMADTAQVTATITAVDTAMRSVTLQFVDGTRKTVKVGKDVDLTKVSAGDSVTAQLTEAVAIVVEKP
jgi:translation elongation factor P/translation initiation factor 5A